MKVRAYRITCLTNLHMGAGAKNYGIVDLEVQRDCVTGEPTMHASGIKGALRSYAEHYHKEEEENIGNLFGKKPKKKEMQTNPGSTAGSLVFFDGDLAFRPCRVTIGETPFMLCTSPQQVLLVAKKAQALGMGLGNLPSKESRGLQSKPVIRKSKNNKDVAIEGLNVSKNKDENANKWIGAASKLLPENENFALLHSTDLRDIELPIVAHNELDDNGESKNLWWEELVPHSSVFVTFVGANCEKELNDFEKLCGIGDAQSAPLQFGANRSVGLGFAEMVRLEIGKTEKSKVEEHD